MQVPTGLEGRFCSLVFLDAPEPEHARCSYVLSRGKNKGTLCNKPGMVQGTVPACMEHMQKYFEAEQVYQAICHFADGTGEMIFTVDSFPRPHIPVMEAFFQTEPVEHAHHEIVNDHTREEPGVVRDVHIKSIPVAIERTNECSVCSLKENPLILPCDHTVCVECMKRLVSRSCPMCRATFEMGQLKRLL